MTKIECSGGSRTSQLSVGGLLGYYLVNFSKGTYSWKNVLAEAATLQIYAVGEFIM